MKKITLYDLLTNLKDVIKFKLSEKLKISSTSENADIEEFYLSEVPLRLLKKKVYNVDYDDNWIEILKE